MRSFAVLSVLVVVTLLGTTGCRRRPDVDLILRGGTIYDGSGEPGRVGDVAIRGDSIVAVGDIGRLTAARVIDVKGLAIAPGFVNLRSRAGRSLYADGTAGGDVLQGVTLEVLGVGSSMGPLSDSAKAALEAATDGPRIRVSWSTLGGYLDALERRGVTPNVASLVGATTLRVDELGTVDRPPTPVELDRMKALARAAMREGALGVGADPKEAPGSYAGTDELMALAKVAAERHGAYVATFRGGERPLAALDEILDLARQSGAPVTVCDAPPPDARDVVSADSIRQRVDTARANGLRVTLDGVPTERGTFAGVFATYVRGEHVLTLSDAVRRLTSLPAEALGLPLRGRIAVGYHADVIVFDPATIGRPDPSSSSPLPVVGARDVFVNGVQVVRNGVRTGARPGSVLRGPGWSG